MRTVIDASEDTAEEMMATEAVPPATLTTTLYDLIAAVQDVAGSHNDALVVATVQHMLRAGRATWGSDVVACGNRPPHPLRGRRRPLAVSA
jgi:hypothetical protein